jgi:hypothetical protein
MDYRHVLINLIVLTIAAIFILLWMRRDQATKAAVDSNPKSGE